MTTQIFSLEVVRKRRNYDKMNDINRAVSFKHKQTKIKWLQIQIQPRKKLHTKKEEAISQLIPPLTARLSDCLFSPPLLTRGVHCLLNRYCGCNISNSNILVIIKIAIYSYTYMSDCLCLLSLANTGCTVY